MKIVRALGGAAALCAFVAVALFYARVPARSFDLQGSPVVVNRVKADITDTYFFPSPTNSNNVVAVMDVQPFVSPVNALSTFFDQGVLYTMKFDSTYGNTSIPVGSKPTENLVIQFSFAAPAGTGQLSQQFFIYGPAAPVQTGTITKLLNGGTASGSGFINKSLSIASGISIFAGVRRNPAFLSGTLSGIEPQSTPGTFFGIFPAQNPYTQASKTCLPSGSNSCPGGFSANGNDIYAGTDVLSIVVEFPKTYLAGLGTGVVAYWATTSSGNGQ